MGVQLYKEPLYRRYYASRCSFAFLFYIVTIFALVLLPFFMAWSSHGFWLKENTYREQPEVTYTYQLISIFQGVDESGNPFDAYYSTVNALNNAYASSVRTALVSSIDQDDDDNGITDSIRLELLMPINRGEAVNSITVMAFFNTRFDTRAKVLFDSVAYVQASTGLPARAVYIDGDFVLRQTWPFQVRGGFREPYDGDPLLSTFTGTDWIESEAERTLPQRIIQQYRDRNFTLNFEHQYTVWDRAPGTAAIRPGGLFNCSVKIRVPIQRVSYTPDASEILKTAWVQYLAMFLVLAFFVDRILSFLYFHQIIETTVFVDTPAGDPQHHFKSL